VDINVGNLKNGLGSMLHSNGVAIPSWGGSFFCITMDILAKCTLFKCWIKVHQPLQKFIYIWLGLKTWIRIHT
jgi:hypothetical protein